jgi:molecular chaperone HscB
MQIDSDDFVLFGLPRRFSLDLAALDSRRRSLQGEVHPDRFAAADPASRRVAMQWAVRVNEAYARLKNPLLRAAYLCELNGVAIDAEDNTAMPAAFLMQQMAWREALDDADGLDAVQRIAGDMAADRDSAYARLARDIDDAEDFALAAQEVRALMFVESFAADVDDRLVAMEH